MMTITPRVRVPRALNDEVRDYVATIIRTESAILPDPMCDLIRQYGEDVVFEAFERLARRIAP